jgi:hypothetical protein
MLNRTLFKLNLSRKNKALALKLGTMARWFMCAVSVSINDNFNVAEASGLGRLKEGNGFQLILLFITFHLTTTQIWGYYSIHAYIPHPMA